MSLRSFLIIVLTAICVFSTAPAKAASDVEFAAAVKALDVRSFNDKGAAIEVIAGLDHPRVAAVLTAMKEGLLFRIKENEQIVIGLSAGGEYVLEDVVSAEPAGRLTSRKLKKISANNKLRVQINAILGRVMLFSKNPQDRLSATKELMSSPTATSLAQLNKALATETDTEVIAAMTEARTTMVLFAGSKDERLAAIETLSGGTDRDIRTLLGKAAAETDDPEIKAAADKAVAAIEKRLTYVGMAQNLIFGLSLGSVLLLAAIGLAITFGVMGVINMAHGEMIMMGAYTTFVVQEIFTSYFPPSSFGWYLVVAIPSAFVVTAAFGMALERSVIRWLYGRPLETLLATWGISLILQQLVRSLFGATNREVANPSWMSGNMELFAGLTITTNRMVIIIFAFAVLAGLAAAIRYSKFGLNMRAVTQNRRMASAMGIPTGRVDAMTFGLGSGIAGIAGVALSQITNVSPNLGQGYIVDSFMVVVFGGVGSLWGTLVAAMSLGIANKFLEPISGAMLGKVLVLIFIILFIQKRPRGLFALRGRSIEN